MNVDIPSWQGYLDYKIDGPAFFDDATPQLSSERMSVDSWQTPSAQESPVVQQESPHSLRAISLSTPDSSSQCSRILHRLGEPERGARGHSRPSETTRTSSKAPSHTPDFCTLSDRTTSEYARLTMTQNMIRIYHDSVENALSCWLTERNCPYSKPTNISMNDGVTNEWGPSWSNRICARVCRLDQASGSIRGRALSATEENTAARALHLSIMAFASQWAQNLTGDQDRIAKASLAEEERSLRKSVWCQAEYALETSRGIPSFRIIFANILFSLTQRPINKDHDTELSELMERDRGQVFLETAVRQMFSYRYKFQQLHRAHQKSKKFAEKPEGQPPLQRPEVILELEQERMTNQHRDTFNLLFWLGIMLDTLTAAMYQRPPVVSDEDSQILLRTPSVAHQNEGQTLQTMDLDGLDFPQKYESKRKQNLWGDMLLHNSASKRLGIGMPTLPCSYEQAAENFSDAAPVKVLFWRRITQLQTLVYREAEPASLEKGIQRALAVYQHWNASYNKFILDCVASHAMLSPRIQSWYVVIAAHWHFGALLLADVIEGIDEAYLSSNTHRNSRNAIDLLWTLRKDNACAIATLAHCSLHQQEPGQSDQFHDCLNGAAFITEPFTVLLINSFTKSANFFLENLSVSQALACCGSSGPSDQSHENLQCCIDALRYLGRKSDMASIVARGLAKRLKLKLESERSRSISFGTSPPESLSTSSCTPDLPIDLPHVMDNEAWMSHFLGSIY